MFSQYKAYGLNSLTTVSRKLLNNMILWEVMRLNDKCSHCYKKKVTLRPTGMQAAMRFVSIHGECEVRGEPNTVCRCEAVCYTDSRSNQMMQTF